ncbi:DUF1016 N-terminal domain-containing protein [Arthrobacter sp. H14-L1]|uniref:DUF1016 N-terminal domain-containing protein n=1 Tax=Arthrobacter sp. H14-L1 TaxID=2996697 RepID=UPI00226FBD36|nr:DUF1016 N-terminal domain-containing protein [Arthrobacter sp. H14-L1]MCY0905767.1 DUF1016 N-terminal domain-containing protein [Arthrobacter sp. H14-L1]
MKGLSYRNLQYMTAMVRAWGADENVPQSVAHLPWGHVWTILDKAATAKERGLVCRSGRPVRLVQERASKLKLRWSFPT